MIVNKDNLNSFQNIENKRRLLAKSQNLELFISTYKSKYDLISNKNTGRMWDKKNSEPITKKNNPIAWDRTYQISKIIKGHKYALLNIGFGSALLEEFLYKCHNKLNQKVHGIDISKKSVDSAAYRFPEWKFILSNIQDFPIKYHHYDYIVASEIFEHINASEILKVMSKIRNLLKNKGKLIISIPVNEGLDILIRSGINPNAHVRIYSEEVIKCELEYSGFKINKILKLYSFHKNYYFKSFIASLLRRKFNPNNLIIIATKK